MAQNQGDLTLRERIRTALRAEGFDTDGANPHRSWRCEEPERYGHCTCLDETTDRVLGAIKDPGTITRAAQEYARLDALEAGEDVPDLPSETVTITRGEETITVIQALAEETFGRLETDGMWFELVDGYSINPETNASSAIIKLVGENGEETGERTVALLTVTPIVHVKV